MNHARATSLEYSNEQGKITLLNLPDIPGSSAKLMGLLAEEGVDILMSIQNISDDSRNVDITLILDRENVSRVERLLESSKEKIGFAALLSDDEVSIISVIREEGALLSAVAHKMFQSVADAGVNIDIIAISPEKLSVLVPHEAHEAAIQAVQKAFGLDTAQKVG